MFATLETLEAQKTSLSYACRSMHYKRAGISLKTSQTTARYSSATAIGSCTQPPSAGWSTRPRYSSTMKAITTAPA